MQSGFLKENKTAFKKKCFLFKKSLFGSQKWFLLPLSTLGQTFLYIQHKRGPQWTLFFANALPPYIGSQSHINRTGLWLKNIDTELVFRRETQNMALPIIDSILIAKHICQFRKKFSKSLKCFSIREPTDLLFPRVCKC